ncbi:MAG: hypothetical protein K2K80_03460 [Clostridia bacterium]|nr:hypothetical protein [Clostridia bacterium]
MKITYDYINCKDKVFSETEYNNLRNEQNKRVDIAFSHGFTVATITLVFFAGIFAFMGDFFKFLVDTESGKTVVGLYAVIDCSIIFAVAFFCGLPNLLILPFSFKYHDNIRVLTNIGAYCRVFYEYPSLISKIEKEDKKKKNNPEKPDNDKEDKKPKVFGWELLHCNGVIPHGNWVAKEYCIISVASLVLSVVMGVVLFACVAHFHTDFFANAWDLIVIIAFIIVFIAFTVGLGFSFKHTRKNTQVKKLFSVYCPLYFEEYVNTAVDFGLFTAEQSQELIRYRGHRSKCDERIEMEIKQLLK